MCMRCDLNAETEFLEKIVKDRVAGRLRAIAERYSAPTAYEIAMATSSAPPAEVLAAAAQQEHARVDFVIPSCAPHFNVPTRLRLVRRAQAAVLGVDC